MPHLKFKHLASSRCKEQQQQQLHKNLYSCISLAIMMSGSLNSAHLHLWKEELDGTALAFASFLLNIIYSFWGFLMAGD